ncbi:hypothetical protein TgHK011_003294 [Trichoderma gracile]|nr:hypothetical protein TgHK011_003294 [Trichoderma gracile]
MGNPIVDLGLSCPKGGRFYICEDQPTGFVGCCTIDPCATADGLCPDHHLQPSSFDPDAYGEILAQDCLDPGFLWYTCRDSSPPFLGCCSQMACEPSGCPASKVGAASLAGNKQRAAPFLSRGSSSSSREPSSSLTKTTSSASSVPSTTLSTVLSTAASTTGGAPTQDSTQPAAVSRPAHPGLSKGAVAGIAVGVIAVGCALAGLFFWWFKQHKKQRPSSTNALATDGGSSGRKDEYGGEDSLASHRDGRLLGAGAAGRGGGAGQIPQAEPSPGLESVISELPATPSQQSITSGATPGRPIVSMVSSSGGVTGRESDASGYTAKQPHSPLMHQTLFELEDSSAGAR